MIGLDAKAYGVVRTNLFSQKTLGDINQAYQALVQEEKSPGATKARGSHENVHAFLVQSEHGKGKYEHVDKSKLHCNLISVSNLVSDNYCTIQFTHYLCSTQDQPSGFLIGEGENYEGGSITSSKSLWCKLLVFLM